MTLSGGIELVRAATRYARDGLASRITFPRDRLGTMLVKDDGERFEVYRETVLRPADGSSQGSGVVLEFGFTVPGPESAGGLRRVLGGPVANVATPFFAGLPGFRRKVWLASDDGSELLELYEWESQSDADRFIGVMRELLGMVGLADAASFDVVDAGSVDEYVASHAHGWQQSAGQRGMRARRPLLALGIVVVAAIGLGFVLAKCRRDG